VEVSVAGASAEDNRAQEEHLARWLTRRLGFPVRLFDLRSQGFELVGGRLLPDAAGPSAQLMYQSMQPAAAGAAPSRVTVYLRKPENGTDFAFRYERQGELSLFYCVDEGVGYAVAGSLPREQLLALAESIYKQQPGAK
jgi:anti-sigma factor RsiW